MLNKRVMLGLIGLHVLVGFALSIPVFSKLFSSLLVLISIFHVIASKNKNNEALFYLGYFVSAEVLFRMTQGFFFWEFGKYATIFIAFIALYVENNKRPIPVAYFYYLIFLLVGIIFTKVPFGESFRKAILFNLSGPIQLGVMAIFCYKRKLEFDRLLDMIKIWLLPIISMCFYLWYRTPSFTEIVFNTESNFATSGGFGPNQVSTALGLGLFYITILLVTKKYFSGIKWLDWLILAYISFRGLLTFSRGGMIAGLLAIIVFAFFYLLGKRNFVLSISRYVIIALAFGVGLFFYTSDLTGGKLENRYSNKNSAGIVEKDLTSGRGKIFEAQIENWITKPIFGIGVGSGKYLRGQKRDGIAIASHNEVTRMLEEHGLIGLLLLLMLLIVPIVSMKDLSVQYKGILLGSLALWFLTIFHSAMRIALPGFLYGLSLFTIFSNKYNLKSED